MAARLGCLAALAGLQLVALVLAHDLTFLARYGSRFGEALVHSGHGETWSAAVATSIFLALVLAGLAAARLARLGLLLRRRDARSSPIAAPEPRSGSPRDLATRWLVTGFPMAGLTAGLLTLQENLERAAIGGSPAGARILLTPEYAGGLWIALAVGFAVALVATLFRWRIAVLLGRLRAGRPGLPRTASAPSPRTGLVRLAPRGSLLGRRSALRAPPAVAAP